MEILDRGVAGVAGLGIPLAVIRYCQAMDELQLRMQLESLAFGFAATAIATFTYGFCKMPACRR